eukprot:1773722-Rhodomonas_salina.1
MCCLRACDNRTRNACSELRCPNAGSINRWSETPDQDRCDDGVGVELVGNKGCATHQMMEPVMVQSGPMVTLG